jgi:hypothetical protein
VRGSRKRVVRRSRKRVVRGSRKRVVRRSRKRVVRRRSLAAAVCEAEGHFQTYGNLPIDVNEITNERSGLSGRTPRKSHAAQIEQVVWQDKRNENWRKNMRSVSQISEINTECVTSLKYSVCCA